MWSLYLLPGRAITQLFFLFPGHRSGNITATRRRNESGCAHFLFATLFWIPVWVIGGLTAIALIVGPSANGRGERTPVKSPGAALHIATGQALDMIGVGHDDQAVASEPTSYQAPAPATPTAANDGPAAQIAANPQAAPKVERAMRKAANSGKAARWKQGRLRGYAVPSDEAVDGCRMVQVSIESAPDLAIAPVQMCEQPQ